MKKLTEEIASAILIANLKEKKKKLHDWVTIAEACKFLVELYGSPKKVAEKFDCTPSLIHQALKILTLPAEVQQLVKEGKILLDVANQLSTIKSTKIQIKIAKLAIGLSSKNVRDMVQYSKGNPNSSLDEYKQRLLIQTTKEKVNILILPLKEDVFISLKTMAKQEGLTPEKLILRWIQHNIGKS